MMKAISLKPHSTDVKLVDVAEPVIQSDDEIKMRVISVGICGTDREEVTGGRADAPPGKQRLIIGHEMLGKVTEIGASVTRAKVGDLGLFMVRRGCGECPACIANRSDMCFTGKYTEKGIKGADGYQSQFVKDKERFFIKVPDSIKDIGVLVEPMSVGAKAIDEAVVIQSARLKDFDDSKNWFQGKKALVAGLGPVGLLTAFALRLRGAEVFGMDIVDDDSLKVLMLKQIGGTYINGKVTNIPDIQSMVGQIDFVFEAAGIAKLQIQLIDTLGVNGIYVATGIPAEGRAVTIDDAASLLDKLVLKNQLVVGSVNASMQHYEMAVDYLEQSMKKYSGAIRKLITKQVNSDHYDEALFAHSPDDIKVIVNWT